ncbi:MAG: sensor histidine kinase [Thermodesulfobacteriota bacterium]
MRETENRLNRKAMKNGPEQSMAGPRALPLVLAFLLVAGLYASSRYSYLLFHTLTEFFCILVIFVVFVLAWNTRRMLDNHYLLFIGIASLSSGTLQLLHTLAYKDFGVFPGSSANPATQLWIAFRFVSGVSFAAAPFFIERKMNTTLVLAGYAAVTFLLAVAVFLGFFPDCYLEGQGLTPFKINSEYFIILIYLAALGLLLHKRHAFDRGVLRLLAASIITAVAAELSFTKYISVFGIFNLVGHLFMLVSVFCIYRAIVVTGLVQPTSLLFRNLKESEEKISGLNRELQQHVAELQESNRELDAFSYAVSHDLRAPLRAIDGFSQALLEDYGSRLGEEGRDYLQRMSSASQRMTQLIEDLLNLSRSGRIELRRGEVDLSAMARDVAENLRKTQPGREVEFVIAPGLTVNGDERLLRVALDNLLGNGWKFTARREQGKIEMGMLAAGGNGRTGMHAEEGNVYYVKDNGAGFAMVYADRLFAPFQRLHSRDEFGGTGIGLATVRRIIERHGGRIWAESAPDQGATFYFTLTSRG